MGIPGLYRWVKERYPKCVVKAKEEVPVINVNGVMLAIDTTTTNPNGIEFDNLYVDMNGIIHPCFHPQDIRGPNTYDEVFEAVFLYIDKLFSLVRPRKLLFLAVDGVAPRAKMNQQRSRRFRAAKDAADEALPEGQESKSSILEDPSNKLDSNVITPGTEFMGLLSSALRYYLHLRMNDDLGWRGIKVILSDASVPGEGEHKIMSYIRLQRNLPGYDPNTRHCLYGLDADLIMLALATHEIHFSILREDVQKTSSQKKNMPKNEAKRVYWLRFQEAKQRMTLEDYIRRQKFQFLHIWILREYLAHDMRIADANVEANLERLIDDFVFMCLFVGNDFLPQIPSLEISEGAINLLLRIYTNEFVKRGGYLTDSLEVNLKRVQHFLQSVGKREVKIFRRRRLIQKKERRAHSQGLSKNKLARDSPKLPRIEQNTESGRFSSSFEHLAVSVQQDSQKQLRGTEKNRSVNFTSLGRNAMINELVRYGGRAKYYAEKFEAKTIDDWERIRRHAVFKYVEGICWVMHYYYEGVCSWQWFYPYHYAPCASDFIDIDQFEIHFTLGEPFKPLDQLMGVLPAASAHALPLSYRRLMTDASSPILEFYPTDFELDMSGKRFSWQAISKLPFIEESRLLSEIAKVEHTLTDEERRRNSLGLDILFLHISHPLAVEINSCCREMNDNKKFLEVKQEIDPILSGGMNGYICICEGAVGPVEIYSPIKGMKMIAKNEILSVFYVNPAFHTHVPRPVSGTILPVKSVCEQDVLPLDILWRTKSACKRLSRRKVSQRAIPESVSGPCLSKEACQLGTQCKLLKETETLQSTKVGDHVDADGLKEVKLKVKPIKRKQSRDKLIEGVVPICDVENMVSNSVGGKSEVDTQEIGVDALVKFKIEEDKSTNRKQIKSDSSPCNISGNLQRCNVEKLESCVIREQSKGDHGPTVLGRLGEQKDEGKSKKKKRRSKKRKVTEGIDIPYTSVEKLGGPRELTRQDGDQVCAVGLQGIGEVNVNVKSERSSNGDHIKGFVGLLGLNTEVKTKKRKGKLSEGDDVPLKSAEKLECSSPRELNKGDGDRVVAVGWQLARTEVNTDGKLESSSHGEQNKGYGDQASAVGLQGVGTEVKPEIKSRKRKDRSKKRKLSEGDYVPTMSAEKLDSSIPSELNKGYGIQVIAAGLQGARTGVTTDGKLEGSSIGEQTQVDVDWASAAGLQGVRSEANVDGLLISEVKSRKKKGRSKKRKLSDGYGIPPESVEILDNSSLGNKGDGDQASAHGLRRVGTVVNADGKWKSSSLGEQNGGHLGDRASGIGLQGVRIEVNADAKLGSGSIGEQNGGHLGDRASGIGLQGVTTEVNADAKLGSSTVEEQNKEDGDRASAFLSLGIKPNERSCKSKLRETDDVPHKSLDKLLSISSGEQNKGDQTNLDVFLGVRGETNVDGLLIPEVKSRKRKHRSKKRKLNDGYGI